ncbi:serine/threonine-protein kinase [Alkaliphilus peptidifermentans]|uniref:non-specific serine/threonine protein kinase n=1 Tax=Alkaliphilus peptidifermentans DSM 18978 TaxID=1120976 RepID=A0A1G5DUJ5_9FIRM|nr:serine/threonine-protein kinase [Alkaliphilus peptidifermentans]SCY18150.1 CobQ/CobB/MinD/ParA nucleotide binding domain-containing protein [Alkaliphilus peptidifermentans DSM 18978]
MNRDNNLHQMNTEIINSSLKHETVDDNLIGKLLKGLYLVEGILGQGGMGKVYLCRNIKLDNLWAVKYIPNKHYKCSQLISEANILKKLNHIHLPKIIDVFNDEKGTYIVESYIEGITLENAMAKHGPFHEKNVIEWGKQLSDVLIYLHNFKPYPIVYRDMKPSNVMITPENKAVLIDFGISIEYSLQSNSSYIPLTLKFAAPEQLEGYADQRTDIFNLGIMLYYLLTKNFPTSNDITKDLKGITKKLIKVIKKCIEKNPKDRYQRVEDLRTELDSITKTPLEIIGTNTIKHIYEIPSDYKKIIAIYSPFSIGKTTIACNLASLIVKKGLTVSLIDTDSIKKDIQYYFDIDFTSNIGKLANLKKTLDNRTDISNIKDFAINISNLSIYTDHRDSLYKFTYEMFDIITKLSDSSVIIVDISNSLNDDVLNKILSACNERLLIIDKYLPNLLSLHYKMMNIEKYNLSNCSLIINRNINNSKLKTEDLLELLNSVEVFGRNKIDLKFKYIFNVPNKFDEIITTLLNGGETLYGNDYEFDEAIENIAITLYKLKSKTGKSKIKGLLKRIFPKRY